MSQQGQNQEQPKLPDIQVLIPYKQLEELLQASVELKSLRFEVKRLRDQVGALRSIMTEIMMKVGGKE